MNKNSQEFDTFIYGQDPRCQFSSDCQQTMCNNNVLVESTTGGGKTLSTVVPNLIHMKHTNPVVLFTKRSTMEKARRVMEKHGYHTSFLNFVDPRPADDGYDPLVHCQTDADIQNLAHTIVFSEKGVGEHDPFWDVSAEQIIEVVLRFVHDGHYNRGCTLLDAVKLLDHIHPEEDFYEETDEAEWTDRSWRGNGNPKAKHPLHYAMRNLQKINEKDFAVWQAFNEGAEQTSASMTSTVNMHMAKTFNSDVREILKLEKQFSFETLLQPQQALFVYTSPVNPATHRFVAIFYHQLFKTLFELGERQPDGRLPYPVHVVCDDFATGCRIPNFDQTISIFREKGISVTMLIQSETQLAGLYGIDAAKTITNNCDTIVYLGGMDLKTCEEVAKRADLPLRDILSMPVGEELFFRRGLAPIRTKRYDTLNDPVYKKYIANAR